MKQGVINKAKEQQRKEYIDHKRLKKNLKDNGISTNKYDFAKKSLKKEMKSLLEKNLSDSDILSQNTDTSFSEYKNLLKKDTSKYLYPEDIPDKQTYKKVLQ